MRPSPTHRHAPRPILGSASAVDPTGAGPGQRPAQRPQGRSPELFQGLHTRKGNFTGLGPLPGLALSSTLPRPQQWGQASAHAVSRLERHAAQCKKCTVQPRWVVERVLYI